MTVAWRVSVLHWLSVFLRNLARRPRTLPQWLSAAVLLAILTFAVVSAGWVFRYALAIHRLSRGVGDTIFYDADGRPWFRMDEQRHDVSIDRIAPDLQHAVIAIEDHRFLRHPGVDPIGLARAMRSEEHTSELQSRFG